MKSVRSLCKYICLILCLTPACTADQALGERPETTGDAAVPNPSGPDDDGAGDAGAVKDESRNPSEDKSAPTVVLSANSTKFTSAGSIKLTATATDASSIKKVVFYADNVARATREFAPYVLTLPVTSEDNGTYSFRAEATDSAGNVGKSSTVSITVDIPADPGTPPPAPIPSFVAAGAPKLVTAGTTLSLATPPGTQDDDLLIALLDAEEASGPRTVTTPAGWTLLGGYPIHNLAASHKPYIIPEIENHGTWVFQKIAKAADAASTAFVFQTNTTARGVVIGYRGVDTASPIHDKSGHALYGGGDTNGFGSGNTTLKSGRQVNLIATAYTTRATYTVVQKSADRTERLNTGEQANGLNLIVHDETFSWNIFTGPFIENKQSPSGADDGFLFSATTLVLKTK